MASDLAVEELASTAGAASAPTALRMIHEVALDCTRTARARPDRDVKPQNIMVFADGRAALGDFGLALRRSGDTRLHRGRHVGYIAPEQAFARARFSSDMFSLGLIAYEVLTGLPDLAVRNAARALSHLHRERCPSRCARCCARRRSSTQPRYADASSSRTRSRRRSPRSKRTRTAPRRRRRLRLPTSPLAVSARRPGARRTRSRAALRGHRWARSDREQSALSVVRQRGNSSRT